MFFLDRCTLKLRNCYASQQTIILVSITTSTNINNIVEAYYRGLSINDSNRDWYVLILDLFKHVMIEKNMHDSALNRIELCAIMDILYHLVIQPWST